MLMFSEDTVGINIKCWLIGWKSFAYAHIYANKSPLDTINSDKSISITRTQGLVILAYACAYVAAVLSPHKSISFFYANAYVNACVASEGPAFRALPYMGMLGWKWILHFYSFLSPIRRTTRKFENSTVTGQLPNHFGFVFTENLVREIKSLSRPHRF